MKQIFRVEVWSDSVAAQALTESVSGRKIQYLQAEGGRSATFAAERDVLGSINGFLSLACKPGQGERSHQMSLSGSVSSRTHGNCAWKRADRRWAMMSGSLGPVSLSFV